MGAAAPIHPQAWVGFPDADGIVWVGPFPTLHAAIDWRRPDGSRPPDATVLGPTSAAWIDSWIGRQRRAAP